jgi:hypothetical protein
MKWTLHWVSSTLLLVAGLIGTPSMAEDTRKMDKELDKLEGYEALPGEKGTKKALEAVGGQPVETMIIWSNANPTTGKAPLEVNFSADPPAGAKAPVYNWDFGDGSAAAQGASVSHTFAKTGIYRVVLKVSDGGTGLGEDELRIKVTE